MEHQSTPSATELKSLEERLAAYPALKSKVESLLSVVESAEGNVQRADGVEQQVIEEIRLLGQAALQDWAEQANQTACVQFEKTHPQAHRNGQKNSTGTVDSGALK